MAREKWAPPGDLEDEEKKEWRAHRKLLVERGDLADDDAACLLALERLCRARQLLRMSRMERCLALTAKGSMGQLVVHPLLAVEAKAEADIASAMADLLLTPRSRKTGESRDDAVANGKAAAGGKVPRGAFG